MSKEEGGMVLSKAFLCSWLTVQEQTSQAADPAGPRWETLTATGVRCTSGPQSTVQWLAREEPTCHKASVGGAALYEGWIKEEGS